MDAESFTDQIERVRSMARGAPKWDLSPNDCAALRAVLGEIERLRAVIATNTAIGRSSVGADSVTVEQTLREAHSAMIEMLAGLEVLALEPVRRVEIAEDLHDRVVMPLEAKIGAALAAFDGKAGG